MDVNVVVGQVVDLLDEHYVFPEIGKQIGRLLRQRLDTGAYAGLSAEELGAKVTADLQSINGDGHTRLRYHAGALPDDHGDAAADAVRRRELAAEWAGGIAQVRLLDDNIGYLQLAPLLFAPGVAGSAVGAAMTLLADTKALILDVRQCLGGDPRMVALICGYLFDDEAVLVNNLRDRTGEILQLWTSPAVPGRRYGSARPVAVLTQPGHLVGVRRACLRPPTAGPGDCDRRADTGRRAQSAGVQGRCPSGSDDLNVGGGEPSLKGKLGGHRRAAGHRSAIR